DLRGIACRHAVAERYRSLRGDEAGDVLEILDAEGNSLERAGLAASDALVRRLRLGEQLGALALRDDRVERVTRRVDARQHELHELGRREGARTQIGRQVDERGGAEVGELHHVSEASPRSTTTRGSGSSTSGFPLTQRPLRRS